MQHDAHEFFVQLIDSINETILGKLYLILFCIWVLMVFSLIEKQQFVRGRTNLITEGDGQTNEQGDGNQSQQEVTWVHDIFQAVVTRELKCLNCEAVSHYLQRV